MLEGASLKIRPLKCRLVHREAGVTQPVTKQGADNFGSNPSKHLSTCLILST